MKLDFQEFDGSVAILEGAVPPIETHIEQVCCCAGCSSSSEPEANPFVQLDLNFDAGNGGRAATANTGLPSFTWDEAAAQISRWNAKWDDEDDAGGVAGNDFGTPGTVTYGFITNPNDPDARAMTAEEIACVLESIQEFEDVANLTFVRVQDEGSEYIADNGDAEMDFQAEDGTNGGYATPNWSNGTLQTSTVNIGVSGLTNYGSWSFKTTTHEIGHAVGLPHPGNYNGASAGTYETSAEYVEDTYMYSVMSYFSHTYTGGDTFESVRGPDGQTAFIGGYATGLLLHDIAALQLIYGANMTTRTGDTVYGFNSTEDASSHWHLSDWQDYFVAAIWDAGGTDTIDASGYYEDQVISLVEESFSSLGGLTYNLSIARGVVIENATGGAGDDRLVGNAADNILDGGAGLDVVDYSLATAGINFDVSLGTFSANGLGTDTLISIEGVVGTEFDDQLVGDDGDNYFEVRGGNDTVEGGLGTDWLSLNGALNGVTINADTLSSGTITLAGIGTNTFTGIEGIEGTSFNDFFNGDESQQLYRGGAGDDTFVASAGGDSYDGGAGTDWLDLRASTSGVGISLSSGTVNNFGSLGEFSQTGFENVHMTSGNDWINATADGNVIWTYAGDDIIYSQQGDDRVYAGAGNDFISAWYGNDTVFAGSGNDEVEGDFGDDFILGEDGDDTLAGGDGADRLFGGAGSDSITGDAGNDRLEGDAGDDVLDGGDGNDRINGGFGDDTITGGLGSDVMDGGTGINTINGGDGNDIIFLATNATDSVDGGAGSDVVSYKWVFGQGVTVDLADNSLNAGNALGDVLVNVERLIGSNLDDVLYGLDSHPTVEVLRGEIGNDRLFGRGGDDNLFGGAGDDYLDAGAGDDLLFGDTGNDELRGGDGLDRIFAGDGNDTLIGGEGNDRLAAGAGDDYVEGGIGNDTLISGGGNDTLIGGDGVDYFFAGAGTVSIDGGSNIDIIYLEDGSVAAVDGGTGYDLVSYRLSTEGFTIDLDDSSQNAGAAAGDTFQNVERFAGTEYDDAFSGSDGSNDNFRGFNGDDVIFGRGGNDTLYGDGGNDDMRAGTGNDWVWGGQGADRFFVEADAGTDRFVDFQDGVDLIVFEGVSGISSFDDLTLQQSGANVSITYGTSDTIILIGIDVASLTADDFSFI